MLYLHRKLTFPESVLVVVDLGRRGVGGGRVGLSSGVRTSSLPPEAIRSWICNFFFLAKCIETEIATTDLELIAFHSTTFNFSRSRSRSRSLYAAKVANYLAGLWQFVISAFFYVERNSFLFSPLPQTQPNPYSHSNFANVSFAVPGEGERGLSGLNA